MLALPLDTNLQLSDKQMQELKAIRIIRLSSFNLCIRELSLQFPAQLINR